MPLLMISSWYQFVSMCVCGRQDTSIKGSLLYVLMSLRSSTKSTPRAPRYAIPNSKSKRLATFQTGDSTPHFFGLGIFSYAFGLGALLGFLLGLLLSPAPWSWSQSSWSWLCAGLLVRRGPLLGRAVLLSGSLSESSSLELSEDDSSLDSPASRGAW